MPDFYTKLFSLKDTYGLPTQSVDAAVMELIRRIGNIHVQRKPDMRWYVTVDGQMASGNNLVHTIIDAAYEVPYEA